MGLVDDNVPRIKDLEPPESSQQKEEPDVVCHFHDEDNDHRGTGRADSHVDAAQEAIKERTATVPLAPKTFDNGVIGCGSDEADAHQKANRLFEEDN